MRMPVVKSIFFILSALAVASCGEDKQSAEEGKQPQVSAPAEETATSPATEADAAPTAEQRQAYKDLNDSYATEYRQRDDVTVLPSGLAFKFLNRGPADGESPAGEDLIRIFYEGKTINGNSFDSNTDDAKPATFPLNGLIVGWQQALPNMRVGDVIELMVPADLGYGGDDRPEIPADSTLMFRIDLRDVLTAEEWLEEFKADQAAFLAENAEKEGVVTLDSGLQYKVIRTGNDEAEKPGPDAVVEAHYEGKLIDGSIFDSSYQRGKPSRFPLENVIAGWTEGLQLMAPGAVYEFTIPYNLAYGENGRGRTIPGYATLVFTVELVSFRARKEEWAARQKLIAEDTAFVADYAKGDGVQLSPSGAAVKILERGNGRLPTTDDVVQVEYVGTLRDGSVFDDTGSRGLPQTILVARNVPGWTEAIQMIPAGSSFEMVIPQDLAYGKEEPAERIPAFSTLVFKGKLLSVRTQDEVRSRLEALQAEADSWFAEKAADASYQNIDPGVLLRTVRAGTGAKASDLARIQFTYVARLRDGKVIFDNSGEKPVPQAVGSFADALKAAFTNMPEGGAYEVILPYSLAYGAGGRGAIPPYAPVVYEIEMLKVYEPGSSASPAADQ